MGISLLESPEPDIDFMYVNLLWKTMEANEACSRWSGSLRQQCLAALLPWQGRSTIFAARVRDMLCWIAVLQR